METNFSNGRGQMSSLFRIKTLTICVSAALAQMPLCALADSASGTDTVMGNAFNPRPVNTSTQGAPVDPEGLGTREPAAHTPTGQMYNMPLTPREDVSKSAGGWDYFGHVEGGVLNVGGDRKMQGFRRYKDVDNSLYLNNFGLTADKKDTAGFVDVSGGGVAKNDQFYSLAFGRYNDWKFKAFYNETAHVFSTTFRSLHDGVGTGNLTLTGTARAAGLTPGGVVAGPAFATNAVVQANAGKALRNTPDGEISLVREKGGFRLDMALIDSWKAYASYSNEKRVGARPFAVVAQATAGGNQSTELAEPINYNSHDLLAGLTYADGLNALNLSLSASFFRNNINSLTYENPWGTVATSGVTAANGGFPTQTVDLYPNNDAYNLKGEYSRLLPNFYKGRFTAVVSLSSSRQGDALLPYTNNANLNAVTGVTAGTQWNTTASLSKPNAGARIDTQLIDLGLAFNPTDKLAVKGKLRSYETDNSTLFLNCNPNATYSGAIKTLTYMGCTGVWGRIAGDGSGPAILDPNLAVLAPGGNQAYASLPWDRKELTYGLNADYRLSNHVSVNAAYERETVKRRNRERTKTWEDKLKLGYVDRGIVENGSLRLSYENSVKRGTAYDANPYDATLGGAILAANGLAPSNTSNLATGWVGNRNTQGRKFELADTNLDVINARFNYAFRPDLDGNVSLQLKSKNYPDSRYGRIGREDQSAFNVDLNYQPSAEASFYGFYSFQNASMAQKGTAAGATNCTGANGFNLALLGTGLAGDPLLCANPDSGTQWSHANAWTVKHRDANDTIGFGFKYAFTKAVLDVNYTYSAGKTAISYAGIGTSAAAGQAGSGMFPDITTATNVLEASLMIPVNKAASVRLLGRLESGRINDWHYQGLDQHFDPAVTSIIVDSGPQHYRTSVIGVLLNYKM